MNWITGLRRSRTASRGLAIARRWTADVVRPPIAVSATSPIAAKMASGARAGLCAAVGCLRRERRHRTPDRRKWACRERDNGTCRKRAPRFAAGADIAPRPRAPAAERRPPAAPGALIRSFVTRLIHVHICAAARYTARAARGGGAREHPIGSIRQHNPGIRGAAAAFWVDAARNVGYTI